MAAYKIENGFILIPKKDFDDMENDIIFLRALEAAGVDSWEGYETAQEMMEEANEKEEEEED